MKIPPQVIELMLKSAGAPQSAIDLVNQIEKMGFSAFALKPADASDANWAKFGKEQGSRSGFYLVANSPTSRALIGVFLEGVNDEVLQGFSALAGQPLLPASA